MDEMPKVPGTAPATLLSNEQLVAVLSECSARLALYNNEIQFNRVQECRDELNRRLEMRSPDLRGSSLRVGQFHVTMNEAEQKPVIEVELEHMTATSLFPGEYPIFVGRADLREEASFEIQRLRAMIVREHKEVPSRRCRATEDHADPSKPHNTLTRTPRWCTRQEGHEGPHRDQHGVNLNQPIKFWMRPAGTCSKCRLTWPCPTVVEAGIITPQTAETALLETTHG